MAARVNVKFVVALSIALVAVMGAVVWAAMTVVLKSGEDYAARAAEFEQAGEFDQAASNWERAVGHDRTRLDWLEGWQRSLKSVEFESEAEYIADCRMSQNILRVMAEVKGPDLQAHREYLDELTYLTQASRTQAGDYTYIASEVDRSLLSFPDTMTSERGQIRRYRGLAGVAALGNGADLGQDAIDSIRADLVAALEGDPSDENVLAGWVQLEAIRADEAVRDRRDEDAAAIWAGLSEKVNAFAEANPESIRGQVQTVNIGIARELTRIQELGLFGADLVQARIDAVAKFQDQSRAIIDSYLQADADRTGLRAANEVSAMIRRVFGGSGTEDIVKVWDHTVAHHPEDVLTIQSRAFQLRSMNRFQEAIDSYQQILDYPLPPVSAEGQLLTSLKKAASVSMGSCAYEQWFTRTTNAARMTAGTDERAEMADSAEAALANARQFRDDARLVLPEDDAGLILLNAKIAFADNDIPTADKLARQYNEANGELDPEGLRLAAEIARRQNQVGEQRRLLERLLAANPNDVRSLLDLAEVQVRLREYEAAVANLTRANEIRPDLEAIENRLQLISAMLGTSVIDDPFEAAIIDAQRATDEGDTDRAIEVLEASLRDNPTPDHIRVHAILASALLSAGRLEQAVEVASAGLEIDPSSTSLGLIKRQAEIGDDVDSADAFIDSLDIAETDKNLRKHRIRLSQGQDEAAKPFLDAARRASPDDRDVMLAAFEFALRTGDLDDARTIIASAEGRDIDGADGLVLRARLEIAEARYDEAERTLNAAVERGSLNPDTLSLLGRVQILRGDTTAAIESFRRAREIRPDDLVHVNNYIRALANAGQQTAALEAARQSLDIGRNNAEFQNLWLTLEGAVGSKQDAYDERLTISRIDPDNAANTAALIRLCIDLRRFDEARTRLDEARGKQDSLALCQLDALWHLQRGDMAEANNQYSAFLISDAEGANTAAAYVAFGSFLIENGQLETGLTTLAQGRRLQSPENPVIDIELSRRLFAAGRYADAVEILEGIVSGPAAGTPSSERSIPVLIETYTRLRDWDAAQALLDDLEPEVRDQLTMRLLQVEVARGRGETDEARAMLDETIAAYPTEPLPYLRRGTLIMRDPSLMNDAIDDLTRAIELNPSYSDAYRFRSICHAALGENSRAAEDIIAASRANPLDDQLRLSAASRLIELGFEDRASDVIDEGIELQASNLRLQFNAGLLFARNDIHFDAVRYLQPAWEQSKDVSVASSLVTSMLELPRPDLRAARQITLDPDLDQSSASVQIIRAQIEAAAENWPAAESLLTDVYKANRDNTQRLLAWSGVLNQIFDSRERTLEYLERLDATETLSPWARFGQARLLATESAGRDEANLILDALIGGNSDQALTVACIRLRSLIHYEDENFEAAADAMRAGLEILPEDGEFNNNLAYTLGVKLDQPAEALPFSQQAVESAPNNRGFLDTLGTLYTLTGEPEQAIPLLEQALSLATTDLDRAPVLVHLAQAKLATGDRPGAEDAADQARRMIESLENPNEDTQAELRDVLDALSR